jgi:hypothetical protein
MRRPNAQIRHLSKTARLHFAEGFSMDTRLMTYATDHTILVFAVVAALLVIGYLLVMRVFARNSRELDRHVDLTKMRVWKDED